jgi:hypothetical protein
MGLQSLDMFFLNVMQTIVYIMFFIGKGNDNPDHRRKSRKAPLLYMDTQKCNRKNEKSEQ